MKFTDLFRRLRRTEMPRQERAGRPAPAAETGPTLSRWYTYGAHLYRHAGEEIDVVFTNGKKGVTRTIVDDGGFIQCFPGVEQETKAAVQSVRYDTRIRFRTDFERLPDGKILMIWQIQPDGRYWEDEDGYGMTPDEEIRLYSLIDDEGRFDGPFRLYNIGARSFCDLNGRNP